jgi:hypothetical protein
MQRLTALTVYEVHTFHDLPLKSLDLLHWMRPMLAGV